MQCRRFFIPRDTVIPIAPARASEPQKSSNTPAASTPAPRLSDDEYDFLFGRYAHASSAYFVTHRDAVRAFYSERSIPFDLELYSAGPSRVEAKALAMFLARSRARDAFPGFVSNERGPFFPTDAQGEAWEWVRNSEGQRVGYSRRILKPRKNSSKARYPRGGHHRAHHVLGWRNAIERSGILAITEGIRKANELARRTGLGAIGLPSTTFTGITRAEVLAAITTVPIRLILLAPDFADLTDGLERHDSTRRTVATWGEIVELARGIGIEVRGLAWDPSVGKGIDDALCVLQQGSGGLGAEPSGMPPGIEELEWEEHLSRWRWHRQPEEQLDNPLAKDAVEPPATPDATRETVRTAAEAHERAREVTASWVPGDRPLVFCGWPGIGKTTAFGVRLLEGLSNGEPGFESRVAVLALPTRDLVAEKLAKLLGIARERGLDVEIIEFLGRSHDESSGWFCEAGPLRAKKLADLHRSACVGCKFAEGCRTTDGRYLHARAHALEKIAQAKRKTSRPLLIVTTQAALHWALGEIPQKAPIVLDDAGALFGLTHQVDVQLLDLQASLDAMRDWKRRNGGDAGAAQRAWNRIESEQEAREGAREALRHQLREAKTMDTAIAAACQWAWKTGVDALRVQERVSRLWVAGDVGRALRSLRGMETSATVLPELLVAEIVERVLVASLSKRFATVLDEQGRRLRGTELKKHLEKEPARERYARETLLAVIHALPDGSKRALREGRVRPPPSSDGIWPWERIRIEHGDDLLPAFTRLALAIARESVLLEGNLVRPPWVRRTRRRQFITLPDRQLLDRARAGYVAWACVGPMPAVLVEELGARQEVVLADPVGLRILAFRFEIPTRNQDGTVSKILSFGPGDRRQGRPSIADHIIRSLATQLAMKVDAGELAYHGFPRNTFGAVLHKVDSEELGSPKWCGHYGRDHAGTDELADREMLLVRRSMVPPSAIERDAEVLRRLFGIPTPPRATEPCIEERHWPGDDDPIYTQAPSEPLEREVARFCELSRQLNAVGRCRPLTAGPDGRVVLLGAGRPFDWLPSRAVQVVGQARLRDLLGVEVVLPTREERQAARDAYNERRAAEAATKAVEADAILRERPETSTRELAERLGVAERSARRIISGEGLRSHLAPLLQTLREAFGRATGLDHDRLSSGHDFLEEDIHGGARPKVSRPGELGNLPDAGGMASSALAVSPRSDIPLVDPIRTAAIDLLPAGRVVAEVLAGGDSGPSRSTVQRALSRIREVLAEGRAIVLPQRSDDAANLAAVMRACIRLLERAAPAAQRPATGALWTLSLTERRVLYAAEGEDAG